MNNEGMARRRAFAATPRAIVLQTAPLLVFYAVIELAAGVALGGVVGRLEALPGILVLLPGLLAMRGDIGEPFAAKVASALHVGTVRVGRWTPDLAAVLTSSLVLTVVMSGVLGVLAWGSCSLTGTACLTVGQFAAVALVTGMVSGVLLLLVGLGAAMASFSRGVDPDDVVTPTVGSLGDVITVLVFVASLSVVI